MATSINISLTASTGETFTLDVNKIVYATNNSDNKAVLTYEIAQGVNQTTTVTIGITDLQQLSSNALFLADVYESDIATLRGSALFCGERVIKLITNVTEDTYTNMFYDTNVDAPLIEFTLDGTLSSIEDVTNTTISVTDSESNTLYGINGFLVGNITNVTDTGDVLDSAVVVTRGATMVAGTTELTLSGGIFGTVAKVLVTNTEVNASTIIAAGTGIEAGITTLELSTGTGDPATYIVGHAKVVSVEVDDAGTGGAPGAATITGTTGTGTKFECAVTIGAGGDITAVGSITVAGDYTVNPTDILSEPVTGGGLVGAKVTLEMGALSITVTDRGDYTVNPTLVAGATTGGNDDVTITVTMGAKTVSVSQAGEYSTPPSNPVSTTGGNNGATLTASFAEGAITGCSISYNNPANATFETLYVQETKGQVQDLINDL